MNTRCGNCDRFWRHHPSHRGGECLLSGARVRVSTDGRKCFEPRPNTPVKPKPAAPASQDAIKKLDAQARKDYEQWFGETAPGKPSAPAGNCSDCEHLDEMGDCTAERERPCDQPAAPAAESEVATDPPWQERDGNWYCRECGEHWTGKRFGHKCKPSAPAGEKGAGE